MSARCFRWTVIILLVFLVCPVVAAPSSAQEEHPKPGAIEIALRGGTRVGFAPRDEPYIDGAPAGGFPVQPVDEILTDDGRPVTHLRLIGWKECGGVRVMAFGLPERGLKQAGKFLASVRVEWDSETEFRALDLLGITYVTIEAGPPPDDMVTGSDPGCGPS